MSLFLAKLVLLATLAVSPLTTQASPLIYNDKENELPVVVFDAVSDVEAASAAPPSPLHSVSSSLGFVLNELFPVENRLHQKEMGEDELFMPTKKPLDLKPFKEIMKRPTKRSMRGTKKDMPNDDNGSWKCKHVPYTVCYNLDNRGQIVNVRRFRPFRMVKIY